MLRFVTDSLIVWVIDEKKAVKDVGAVIDVNAVIDVDGKVCTVVLVTTSCVVIFVDGQPTKVKNEINCMKEPILY